MIEHNYYKLLELENFSDASVVSKRYRSLARKYHPDLNPGKADIEEYFKILTQGYNILSDAESKIIYDRNLRSILEGTNITVQADTNFSETERIRRNFQKRKERIKNSIINDYEKDEADFAHKHRKKVAILMMISGFLIAYNNWFINYKAFNIIFVLVGLFMFGVGVFHSANIRFKTQQYNMVKNDNIDFDNISKPISQYWKLMFLVPIGFLFIMYATKVVHLNYFYDYTIPDGVVVNHGSVTYEYHVGNKEISRVVDIDDLQPLNVSQIRDRSLVRVKYSRINPVISELVPVSGGILIPESVLKR